MAWFPKSAETAFDSATIEGLNFLDGDLLAAVFGKPWSVGQKCPFVTFPSKDGYQIWEGRESPIIHLFGEMDLPYSSDLTTAIERADYIAQEVGYLARRVGENQLEVIGRDKDEHLIITYDNQEKRMIDVVQVAPSSAPFVQPLFDRESRNRLPSLRKAEEKGDEAIAQVKFFTPDSSWTWYASGFDGDDIFFGLVIGHEIEYGYFSLTELMETRGVLGLPIERDRYFEPELLAELEKKHRKDVLG